MSTIKTDTFKMNWEMKNAKHSHNIQFKLRDMVKILNVFIFNSYESIVLIFVYKNGLNTIIMIMIYSFGLFLNKKF